MNMDVLVATLNALHPAQLIESVGVKGGAVIVNQGSGHESITTLSVTPLQRLVHTSERGLARSRNRALETSTADVCLLADDDERLHPHYTARCERAFDDFPTAGVIGFAVPHWDRVRNSIPTRSKVGPISAMRLTSVQLAIRRDVLRAKGVRFDERFGAGARYPAGEEYIFLRDALRAGIEVRAVPLEVASLGTAQAESTWFRHMDKDYLDARGAIFRRADPRWHSALALQWALRKRRDYEEGPLSAYSALVRGGRRFAQGDHEPHGR